MSQTACKDKHLFWITKIKYKKIFFKIIFSKKILIDTDNQVFIFSIDGKSFPK